jgi:hypothetical protein
MADNVGDVKMCVAGGSRLGAATNPTILALYFHGLEVDRRRRSRVVQINTLAKRATILPIARNHDRQEGMEGMKRPE